MSETGADAVAVKERLLSLYGSSRPQLFTQILVDYDADSRRLTAESARVHDLRAAARVQILFADGFKEEAAIRFLQEAIRHIEASGLPPSDGLVLYPDGSEPARQLDHVPPKVAQPALTATNREATPDALQGAARAGLRS